MSDTLRSRPPSYFPGSQVADGVPPVYQGAIVADPQERFLPDDLQTQHKYTLSSASLTGKIQAQPWLTLELSTGPTNADRWKRTPRYFGGDSVSGTIKLAIDGSQNISAITILLKGRIITSFSEWGTHVFLEHTIPIWNGKHSLNGPGSISSGQAVGGPHTGQRNLKSGNLEIPFSFPFPTEVNLTTNTKGKCSPDIQTIFPTPQSFLERDLPSNIDYELVVRVKHGLLRADTKLKVPVVFIPRITPDPVPPRRQAAYLEGAFQLPSPLSDPEGWEPLEPCTISGVFGSDNHVDVECSIYLARPLCYTRGTVIPCYMTLSSRNSQALEQLAKPEWQNVRLTRNVIYFEDAVRDIERYIGGKVVEPSYRSDEAEVAVWWELPKHVSGVQSSYSKTLEGEIHLSEDLIPSSNFCLFRVEYAIEVLPFKSTRFTADKTYPSSSSSRQSRSRSVQYDQGGADPRVILRYPVTIATFNASQGPIPAPYTARLRRPSTGSKPRNNHDHVTYVHLSGLEDFSAGFSLSR
ncbi:hypothetical protein BJ165DRAFT_114949 [Panaeolus papilionaceus]|nr:hypothetical protein BJ165DRAFT_114949 [Panaeolus papilionaceus]